MCRLLTGRLCGCSEAHHISTSNEICHDRQGGVTGRMILGRVFEAGNPRVTKIAVAHLIGLIEPEDIANMAVFLASDESRLVTGHVYPVDSGVTIS
jgi:NAD(P)-dependent dehydrogenase (short-subunit alcohol dehydrogenase family)